MPNKLLDDDWYRCELSFAWLVDLFERIEIIMWIKFWRIVRSIRNLFIHFEDSFCRMFVFAVDVPHN